MVAGEIARPIGTLVIGGGPGGYTAAARLAELGRDVVLVEAEQLGGTCLNVGCIPSKALISVADDLDRVRRRIAAGSGLVGELGSDLKAAQRWKDDVVTSLRSGVETLLGKVEVVVGVARFIAADKVAVESADHVEYLQFEQAIVATGSRPATLADLPTDGRRVLDSTGLLALDDVPSDLVVVGGGYIGVELGTAFAKLGARVTIVDVAARLLGEFDADLVRPVLAELDRLGVTVRTATRVPGFDDTHLELAAADGSTGRVAASHVLVSVGRVPNTDDLQLADAGLAVDDRGLLVVDAQLRTSAARIFAIGDVTAGPALAHKASAQGRVAAEVICGEPSAFDQVVPLVAFTSPEIAAVGLDESAAAAGGIEVVVGKGSFRHSGRALTRGDAVGFVKLVVDRSAGFLLGAQVVGPEASELIAELTVAVECALRLDDLTGVIHAHPTLAEAVADAATAASRRR